MIKSLTRSRSADFHRATLLRLIIVATVLWVVWEPLRPIRTVTSDALSITASQLRR